MGGGVDVTKRYFGTAKIGKLNHKLGDRLNILNIYKKGEKAAIGINNDTISSSF